MGTLLPEQKHSGDFTKTTGKLRATMIFPESNHGDGGKEGMRGKKEQVKKGGKGRKDCVKESHKISWG